MAVGYIGLKGLNEFETDTIKSITEREQKRIFRPKHKLESAMLSISVKTTNAKEDGGRTLYTIALKLNSPSTKKGVFEVKTNGWELENVLHAGFEALYNLLQHRLKVRRGGSYRNA